MRISVRPWPVAFKLIFAAQALEKIMADPLIGKTVGQYQIVEKGMKLQLVRHGQTELYGNGRISRFAHWGL